MNDEREIKFIYSEKFDEKNFNRLIELMKTVAYDCRSDAEYESLQNL